MAYNNPRETHTLNIHSLTFSSLSIQHAIIKTSYPHLGITTVSTNFFWQHPSHRRSSEESLEQSLSLGSGTSKPCLREINWHPVPERDNRGTNKHSDYASVQFLQDILSFRVNHHLPRKNTSHLQNSTTVKEWREKKAEDKCITEQIPKKLHWIWFGTEIPDKYVNNIVETATINPGWEIFLWSELPSQQLEDRLAQEHGCMYNFKNVTEYLNTPGVLINGDLIKSEKNLAGKSDYLRLEVLYIEGGIYLDTDSYSVQAFDNFGDLFRWPFGTYIPEGYHKGTIQNSIFGFAADSVFLLHALKLTRENCLTYQRCGVMTGAGPDFLTAAHYYFDDSDIVLFHQDYLLRKTEKSVIYQTNDATWVAAYKP